MHSDFLHFIEQQNISSVRVIDAGIPLDKYTQLDLSIDNKELQKVDVSSSKELSVYVNSVIEQNNAQVAFGGYLETRGIYRRSDYFNQQSDPNDERNIHLGVDIWIEAGTKVLAAFDGEIHSFKNNTNFGDYGPAIILKHTFSEKTFYSLYGHLSLNSIENLEIGEKVKQGEKIGELGTSDVNGDYPPHLHFQVIMDIQNNFGDYPGVCSVNQLDFYKNNCPNPLSVLGLE